MLRTSERRTPLFHVALQAPVDGGTAPLRAQWRRNLLLPGFLLLAAVFLYWDAASVPVVLWDESRNIANALEMRTSGLSLVTTYEFQPDLWNTKPPLLIWLMSLSLSLFGPVEWAMRVPSMAASIGTLLVAFLFARRVTGSQPIALCACAILLLSPAFFGGHGARTADYDALLLFFTTSYLSLLFLAVGSLRARLRTWALAGAAVAAAVLSKSTAGLLPGIGVAVYLLATNRLARVLRQGGPWVLAVVAALPVLLFYAARETVSPGYVQAVIYNELSGRFGQSLIGRNEPWYFYARDMFLGWFSAAELTLLSLFGWRHVRGKSRALLLYCLCIALSLVILLSVASTKLPHYALPAYPFLAIAAALLFRGSWERLRGIGRTPREKALLVATVALLLALPTARSLYWRFVALPESQATPESHYGDLFAALYAMGIRDVTIVDPGFSLEGWTDYAPMPWAYQLLWRERGLHSRRGTGGAVLASCNAGTIRRLRAEGKDLVAIPHCAAITSARADPAPARAALRAGWSQSLQK